MFWKKFSKKEKKYRFSKIFSTILYIAGAIVAIYFLEFWGLVGILIFIFIIALYRLYKNRVAFDAGMSNIETFIFGKPLKKEYWEKGELKNTKIKLGFGKSKFMTKKHYFMLFKLALFAVALLIILIWVIR